MLGFFVTVFNETMFVSSPLSIFDYVTDADLVVYFSIAEFLGISCSFFHNFVLSGNFQISDSASNITVEKRIPNKDTADNFMLLSNLA